MSKLIVIRGNSGSGKSTLASLLQPLVSNSIVLEQDYYIKYTPATKTVEQERARKARIFNDIKAALKTHETVIVEGVFDSRRYTDNFTDLLAAHPSDNYFFYLDIPFTETLRRHETRDKRHQFGETEMTNWYAPHDRLGYNFETVFDEHDTTEAILDKICTVSNIPTKVSTS